MHIHFFDGGNALSDFRVRQLLPRLQAVNAGVESIRARHVHLVGFDQAPNADELDRLGALLTYGEPFAAGSAAPDAAVVVAPGHRKPPISRATAASIRTAWSASLNIKSACSAS